MKYPVPILAEMGTTDRTCSVLLFLQLVRVVYPKIKSQNLNICIYTCTNKPARIFSLVDYRVQYKIKEEAKVIDGGRQQL